jgi:hypothetical protein
LVSLPLPLLAQTGCDAFHGSVVAMAVAFPQQANMPTPLPLQVPGPGGTIIPLHLEMWARINDGTIPQYQRLAADVGADPPESFPGFQVVRAIDPNDQCLVRGLDSDDERCTSGTDPEDVCGASLFSRKAQVVTEGTTADQLQLGLVLQARKVTASETKFNAVDPNITGRAPIALLALVRNNPDAANDPRRRLPPISTTTAEEPTASVQRLNECYFYRNLGSGAKPDKGLPNPNFYVGNPRQYTKPISGTLFGVFSFATAPSAMVMDLPSQNFSGITFSVPANLTNIEEFLVTLEPPYDPATMPAPSTPAMTRILYHGVRQPDANSGRGVIRLVMRLNVNPMLNPPVYMNAGTAAILSNLDASID